MHLLIHTLIVPLDSEDIERLISALDDALDGIEATAVRMLIFKIEAPTERARQLAHLIRSGALRAPSAMPNLREKKNFRQVNAHIVEINTLENNGDRVLREALVEIVKEEVTCSISFAGRRSTRCSKRPRTVWRTSLMYYNG